MKAIIFLLLLVVSSDCLAQSALPFKKNSKWGIIDVEGNIVLAPTHDFISTFKKIGKEELAIFRTQGNTGLLDNTGKIRLSAIFEKIIITDNQKIVAWKDDKATLLDLNGKELIPPKYDYISDFHEEIFVLIDGEKYGIANLKGDVLLEPSLDDIEHFSEKNPHVTRIQKAKKWGLINKKGEILAQPLYESMTIFPTEARGKKGMGITLIRYDQEGNLTEAKDFPNQTALDIFLKNEERKKLAEAVQKNPKQPPARWTQEGLAYKLINPMGDDLLKGKRFFDVGFEEKINLFLAREFIKSDKQPPRKSIMDEPVGKTYCYLIDHTGKILFQVEAEDLMLSDFVESQYARLSIDTLWDALINKKGEVLRKIGDYHIENIGNFVGGRAFLKSNNLYGFIDGNAQLVIPIQYEVVSDFEECIVGKTKNYYAIAKKDGKYGLIDTNGKNLIPFAYDGISMPKEGVIRYKNDKGKWGALDMAGKPLIPAEYDLIGVFENGKAKIKKGNNFGLVDNKGKIVLTIQIDCDDMQSFQNGIARISKGRYIEKTGIGDVIRYKYHGIVKENGEILLPPVYSDLGDFEKIWQKKSGITQVRIDDKVGYVDYKGQTILHPRYQKILYFDSVFLHSKGWSQVVLNGKVGYINHRGEEVIPPIYCSLEGVEKAYRDSTQFILACLSKRFGVINHRGKEIISFEYDAITNYNEEGMFIAQKNGKWGLINLKNHPVMDFIYDGMRFVAGSGKKLVEVYKENPVTYYVSPTGEIQSSVPTFSEKKENFQILKKGETVALAKNNKPLTKYEYLKIGEFSEGLAYALTKDLRYGYLNEQGEMVIAPAYTDAQSFSNGLAAVKAKGKWGFIDKTGNLVIKHQFNEVMPFTEDLAVVEKTKIIDKKGEVVGELAREGTIIGQFYAGRAVAQSVEGMYHVRKDGMPAYGGLYDEVTPFAQEGGMASIAFVKKGELWELKRLRNYTEEITITFTRANKNKYEKENPDDDRKIKTPFGEVIQDKGWRLIQNGTWKMIARDGTLINEAVFSAVKPLGNGFEVTLNKRYGIARTDGTWLIEPICEVTQNIGEKIVRLEQAGNILYLTTNGKWIINK